MTIIKNGFLQIDYVDYVDSKIRLGARWQSI